MWLSTNRNFLLIFSPEAEEKKNRRVDMNFFNIKKHFDELSVNKSETHGLKLTVK